MRLSLFISSLAWISVFILGGLGSTGTILVDGLLIGYWIFCFATASMAAGFSMPGTWKKEE